MTEPVTPSFAEEQSRKNEEEFAAMIVETAIVRINDALCSGSKYFEYDYWHHSDPEIKSRMRLFFSRAEWVEQAADRYRSSGWEVEVDFSKSSAYMSFKEGGW